MTKILVSPGYGAGWSTWAWEKEKQVAEYAPIIKFIEDGGDPTLLNEDHELIKQMIEELGLSHFCCGGTDTLEVQRVDGPYCIEDYDGYESVKTSANFW